MPDVLQDEQQVHMGLLMAQLLDASNNPTRIYHIKEIISKKWFMKDPDFPELHIPSLTSIARGTFSR